MKYARFEKLNTKEQLKILIRFMKVCNRYNFSKIENYKFMDYFRTQVDERFLMHTVIVVNNLYQLSKIKFPIHSNKVISYQPLYVFLKKYGIY